jgi:hypothetical protein
VKPFRLRPYQRKDVKKALKSKTRGVINGSIMGAGKTLFGVEVMRKAGTRQVLIIGPMNTADGWASTVERQVGVPLRIINSEAHTNKAYAEFLSGMPGWFFIHWELARMCPYEKFTCDGVIFDEIHRAGSHELMRTVVVDGRKVQRKKVQANNVMAHAVGKLVAERGGYRIGLSGTWKGNKEEGAWAVRRAIWPLDSANADSFWRFAKRHIEIKDEKIYVRGKEQEVKVLGRELSPGSIVADLPCYIRHEADSACCEAHPHGLDADLPKRLPPRRVGVDLSPTQRKIYDQLEEEMLAWIEENDWPLSSEGYPIVNLIRLHQVCLAIPSTELAYRLKKGSDEPESYIRVSYPLTATSAKLDALEDIVRDLPPGDQFVVYTHSAGIVPVVVARLTRLLGSTVEGWTGALSGRDRGMVKRRFIAGDVQALVCQVAAIAEGVDGLQSACHNEIWLSKSENRVINEQAARRLHRSGQKHPVQVWEIVARDTVEDAQHDRMTQATILMNRGLKA